jgi:hypothetical protein
VVLGIFRRFFAAQARLEAFGGVQSQTISVGVCLNDQKCLKMAKNRIKSIFQPRKNEMTRKQGLCGYEPLMNADSH